VSTDVDEVSSGDSTEEDGNVDTDVDMASFGERCVVNGNAGEGAQETSSGGRLDVDSSVSTDAKTDIYGSSGNDVGNASTGVPTDSSGAHSVVSADGDVSDVAATPSYGETENAYTDANKASDGDVLASSGDADQSNVQED